MKCNKYADLIPLYLLDELNENEKSDLKKHLKECTTCQVEFQEMQKTVDACSGFQSETLTEIEQLRLQNSIFRSVLSHHKEPKKFNYPVLTYISRTAAAILIFASGFVIASYNQVGNPGSQQASNYKTEMPLQGKSFQGYAHTSAGLKLIAKGSKEFKATR